MTLLAKAIWNFPTAEGRLSRRDGNWKLGFQPDSAGGHLACLRCSAGWKPNFRSTGRAC